jgi:surfeit locus 1 family protein
MSAGPFAYQPRLLTTAAALIGIVLTFFLGQWQLGRADYKQALQSRQDALSREPMVRVGGDLLAVEDIQLRHVEIRGEFLPAYTVFVDNRIYKHQPGYYVATPMRIAGSRLHVLVNRGWVAAGRGRGAPTVETPAGEQVVRGTAVAYSDRFIELSTKVAEGNIWQNLVLERFRQATKLDLQPFLVQQQSDTDDGIVRDWSRPDLGRNTHLAYAFQWFALSLAILIYYLVTHVKRRPAPQQP